MNLSKLKLHVDLQSKELPTRFNFGKQYKDVAFEDAIHHERFISWYEYIMSIQSKWGMLQEDDMDRFHTWVEEYADEHGCEKDDPIDQIHFIRDLKKKDEPISFKAGIHKGKAPKDVPKDFRIRFIRRMLNRHPAEDSDYWEKTEEGRDLALLLQACSFDM